MDKPVVIGIDGSVKELDCGRVVGRSVLQAWVTNLPFMQQAVLLSAIRGPDGVAKGHQCKDLIRFYRRCVLISAFTGEAILDPFAEGGGSFTGPVISSDFVDNFMKSRDELPFHYFTHFMHGSEIVAYKHSDKATREFWSGVYERMVNCLHLYPEKEGFMDRRLSDNEINWLERCDESGSCST